MIFSENRYAPVGSSPEVMLFRIMLQLGRIRPPISQRHMRRRRAAFSLAEHDPAPLLSRLPVDSLTLIEPAAYSKRPLSPHVRTTPVRAEDAQVPERSVPE